MKFTRTLIELGLPVERWENLCSDQFTCYRVLNGAAYVVFNNDGEIEDYHGGYE